MATVIMLSAVSCGKDKDSTTETGTTEAVESSTADTYETTDATDGTEGTELTTEATEEPTTEDETKSEEPKKTEPDETTKPAETTKPIHTHSYSGKITKNATCSTGGTKTFSCSCGSSYTEAIPATGHKWGNWITTKEPTTSAEGNSQRKCSNCGATENKAIAKLTPTNTTPYYLGYEIVSVSRPNTCYIDGVDILSKIYGTNKAFQSGDTITYQINMSDGSSKGIEVVGAAGGCTYTVNGNRITIKFTSDEGYAEWCFGVVNKNGGKDYIKICYDVLQYNGKLETSNEQMGRLIELYARVKYGMGNASGLPFAEMYTVINGPEASVTGNFGPEGTADDYFYKNTQSNWIKYAFYIIDQYNVKGLKKVYCSVSDISVGFKAGY